MREKTSKKQHLFETVTIKRRRLFGTVTIKRRRLIVTVTIKRRRLIVTVSNKRRIGFRVSQQLYNTYVLVVFVFVLILSSFSTFFL